MKFAWTLLRHHIMHLKHLYLLFLFFTSSLMAISKDTLTIKTKSYNPKTNLVNWPNQFNPEHSRLYVHNEIFIQAKPEVVWSILIDAKQWHTFYKGVESPVEYLDTSISALRLDAVFKLHTMGVHLKPVIKEFIPNERMAWEVNRGNLKAYHAWVIVPTSNGCRLITPEVQNGFLALMQKAFLPNKLLNLHEHWLEVIKIRAESQAHT